ncbi:MAG: DUF2130 domain-containing protein [Phycisphaerae bacterium]|nr:DUF2130 domain-containing protein [Phycisphaerae bacterium]
MQDKNIKCPNCGTEIELTEALTGQIESDIKARYQSQAMADKQELQKQKELLAKQSAELEAKQATIDDQVASQLKLAKEKLIAEQRAKILDEQSEANKALQDELAEKTSKLSAANKKELELLKQQRTLEEKAENIELEVQRKLTDERKKIAADATEKAAEDQKLKMREKDDLIKAMQEQVANLKRRADLGSQEAQGEALEMELKELLEREFPYDQITEVKKGARGADVLQIVHNPSGSQCGKILWESKNTKDFQKPWVEKLKKDQQQAQADIAVLMSVVLPANIKGFGIHEGIWVTDYKSGAGLAAALRQGIIEAHRQKAITAGRDSIKDVIYNYITSQEFALHISSVMNSYKQMQEDLESEKRAMARIWKKREKQITTVLDNVSGMYGSIEGIVGTQKALPPIDALELEDIGNE